MFKKQIKNLVFSRGWQRGLQLLFVLIILASQAILVLPQGGVKEVEAVDKFCTYDSNGFPRPLSPNKAVKVDYTGTPSPRDPNSTSAFKAVVDATMLSNVSQYFLGDCKPPKVTISAFLAWRAITSGNPDDEFVYPVSKEIPLDPITSFSDDGSGLRLNGQFNVADLSNFVLESQKASILALDGIGTNFRTVYAHFKLVENGKENKQIYGGTAVKLYGCGGSICYRTGDRPIDPTTTNDRQIKIGDIVLAERTTVPQDSPFLPSWSKGTDRQNFVRIYIDNGTIKGFALNSTVFFVQPTNKTLYINYGGNSTEVYIEDDTPGANFNAKKIKSLDTGAVEPKLVYKTDSDYGCIKDSVGTNYAPGQNVQKDYNLCNPYPSTRVTVTNDQAIEPNTGYSFGMAIDEKALAALHATKTVTCTNEDTGEGCDETVNQINILPILNIDLPPDDTTWKTKLIEAIPFFGNIYGVWNNASALYRYYKGLPLAYPAVPFYVQIYKSEKSWRANLDKEKPASVPDPADAVGSAQINSGSAANSLYAFIVRVISSIIVWLQSIIYAAFAYILVPILNALLKVRPYKDDFVGIIYPGWLILRNLANIFFIVSLLVVGLRILFQQSAAATARSFILRLVIMALLLNFSLVIAQGLVGIADTVQSQFLPKDTKIIESLGSKLMVEPLKAFRAEVASNTDVFTDKNAENSLADTIKPLVLLMLSVASFFSFLALAAFLLVRLVALWVLYMLSPIAYVGYVMEETKTYAKQWWKEFLKYAIVTPVMVFFLNIAALMAVVFSGQNNSLFNFGQGLGDDIVAGALTIISHFIVLFFIYAGMKFALSSGTFGAKAIVDYAQKGFQNTLTKWPKAGLDYVSDKSATKLDKEGYTGSAKIVTALTHPLALGRAAKKKWIDEPGEERKGRDKERLEGIPFLTKSDKKTDLLKGDRETAKDKSYGDEDTAALEDIFSGKLQSGDRKEARGALFQLAKNGDIDEILRATGKVTGKSYNKNAAGLGAAMNDIQSRTGMSQKEKEAYHKKITGDIKKDKNKSHYLGNSFYDKDAQEYRYRQLDPNDPAGRFTDSDYRSYVKDQVAGRTKMSVSEDMNKTGIDSMVNRNAAGDITDFSDSQIGVFAKSDLTQMQNFETRKRFQTSDNFNKLSEAFRHEMANPAELRRKITQYQQNYDPSSAPLSEDQINQRVQAVQSLFVGPTTQQAANQDGDDDGDDGGERGPTVVAGVGRNADGTPRAADESTARGNRQPIIARTIGSGPVSTTKTNPNSEQVDSAQRVSDVIRFGGGGPGDAVKNSSVIGDPTSQTQGPEVGYADSKVAPRNPGKTPRRRPVAGFGRNIDNSPRTAPTSSQQANLDKMIKEDADSLLDDINPS